MPSLFWRLPTMDRKKHSPEPCFKDWKGFYKSRRRPSRLPPARATPLPPWPPRRRIIEKDFPNLEKTEQFELDPKVKRKFVRVRNSFELPK